MQLLGIALIIATAIDGFMTILSLRGGGYLTNRWTRGVWNAALWIHRRYPIHAVLGALGPLMAIVTVLVWYAMLLTGWSLIFISGNSSVIENQSGLPTDFLQRFYFVGTTLSGVGYGDLVPNDPPWTMLSNIAAFTTSFLVATSLSYVIPVIGAALQRRQLAENIHAVGEDPQTILENSWTKQNSEMMDSYWTDLLTSLNEHAHKHLVYPVLHYFHSPSPSGAVTVAILRLSDAIFLIEQSRSEDERPPPVFYVVAKRALHKYSEMKQRKSERDAGKHQDEKIDHLQPATLRKAGLEPVDDEQFQDSLKEYLELRKKLLVLCREDGWEPKDL